MGHRRHHRGHLPRSPLSSPACYLGELGYFHVEINTHDILLAEGAASETFVDDDSCLAFHNAPEYARLYPGEEFSPALFCAPVVERGEILARIQQRLAALARPVHGHGNQREAVAGRIK